MPKRIKFLRKRAKRRGTRMRPANAALHDVKMPEPMMLPVTTVQRVQLRGYAGVSTTAGGIISSYISFDPGATTQVAFGSATQFLEWTSFINLFQEVKVLQFEVQCVRFYADETKGDVWGPIAIAGNSSPVLASPGNYQACVDNGDSQLWSLLGDQSGMNRYHAVRLNQLAWANVSNTNPGSSNGIAAGCPGSIIFYANSLPASSTMFSVKYTGTYLVRTRV